jgi:hypothetical protein
MAEKVELQSQADGEQEYDRRERGEPRARTLQSVEDVSTIVNRRCRDYSRRAAEAKERISPVV